MKRSISNLNFAFSISDQYIHYVSVTIKSIIENHRGIEKNIYVLSDVVSERSRKLLDEVVNGDECTHLKIIIVDDTPLRGLSGKWSIYTWYRLLLPQYLPDNVHKVLYLDADVIVLENLVDLFSIDMEGIAVADSRSLSLSPRRGAGRNRRGGAERPGRRPGRLCPPPRGRRRIAHREGQYP